MVPKNSDKNDEDTEDLIVSYLGLRKSVGTIGILLPIALLIAAVTNSDVDMQDSISQFYHTNVGVIFTGALLIIGAFLGSYRGYPPQKGEKITDRQLALIAALGAIVTALIPSAPEGQVWPIQTKIHLLAAATFLLAIGYLSYARFTRSESYTVVYKTAGQIIFTTLAIIACIMLFNLDESNWLQFPWLFWLEAIAVWAFGVSWLVKGKFLEDRYGAKVVNWFKSLT